MGTLRRHVVSCTVIILTRIFMQTEVPCTVRRIEARIGGIIAVYAALEGVKPTRSLIDIDSVVPK